MKRDDLIKAMSESDATQLAVLAQARENAKQAVLTTASKSNLDALRTAERMLEEFQEKHGLNGENQAPMLRTFKTQLEAVDYLKSQGYKVEKSKFNKDFKAGRVPRTPDGLFEAGALLGYAGAHLQPAAKAEDSAGAKAAVQRSTADARLKDIQAARQELKFQREQGLLMPRVEHEQDMAARALFFKAEIESFIYRRAGEIIALVAGDETRQPRLVEWWAEATADWMDAWSADREFSIPGDDDEPETAPAGESLP